MDGSISLTQTPSTSLLGTSLSGKNTTIILPGDKKPKTIGGGRKTEIKADVVSGAFYLIYELACLYMMPGQFRLHINDTTDRCAPICFASIGFCLYIYIYCSVKRKHILIFDDSFQ